MDKLIKAARLTLFCFLTVLSCISFAAAAPSKQNSKIQLPIHIFLHEGESVTVTPRVVPDSSQNYTFQCESIGLNSTLQPDNSSSAKSFTFQYTDPETWFPTAQFRISTENGLSETFKITVISPDFRTTPVILHPSGGTWRDGTDSCYIHLIWNTSDGSGETSTLSEYSNGIERDGFLLVGWNTALDGSGIWYTTDSFITDNPPHDLYAQWIKIPDQPTVVFNTHQGSLSPENSGAKKTELISISAPQPIYAPPAYRDGYDLVGWSASGSGDSTGHFYFPGELIPANESFVLYALWAEEGTKKPVFIYDTNAPETLFWGTQISRKLDYKRSTSDCIYFSDLEREGYLLTGWATEPDGSGKQYALDATIQASEFPGQSTIHLYAQWEKLDLPQDYLVFCAGEPVFPDGKSYLVIDRSQPYTVPDLPFPFIAWTKIGPSNEAQLYLIPDETLPVSENAYLYPLVEGVEWGMNFLFCSANGGTFSSAKGNHLGKLYPGDRYFKEHWSVDEYDRDIIPIMSQLSSHIKRDNHRLIGWNTRADGSGTQYQIGEAVPCAGLRTVLYAQWEKATSSGSLVQTDLKWSLYADRTLILDGKAPANSTIFSACYDSDERLLSIAEIGIGEPLSLSDSAKVCTLFVLNQDSIPLCPSRDIVLS